MGVCPAPLSAANQQALGRQLTNKIISAPPGQLDYGTQVQPLNEFVRFAYGGQPMTAQWLSLICFRLAAERTWTDVAAGRSGWIWLIKFGSSAGAAEYVTGQLRGYLTVKHAEFSVSGVSGGVGIETLSAYRGGGKATWLLGYRGDLAINVTLVYPANASPQRSAAIRLLQEQVGRL